MKRCLILLLSICMLLTSAVAESGLSEDDVQKQLMVEGERVTTDYALQALELMQNCEDNDTQSILNMSVNMLLAAQAVLEESLTAEKTLTDDIGELLVRENDYGTLTNGSYYDTCVCWIEKTELWAYVSLYWREDYVQVKMSYYTDAGELVGSEALEIGHRDNTTIFFFVDFDAAMQATLRVAVKAEDKQCEALYTKTLGENWNFYLNVNAWQKGEELGEWDKKLLYALE